MKKTARGLPAIPGVNSLPGIKKTGVTYDELGLAREPVVADRAAVDAYAELCGFPVKDTVRGFKMILDGELDHIAEGDFYMKGSIDEVLAAAGKK